MRRAPRCRRPGRVCLAKGVDGIKPKSPTKRKWRAIRLPVGGGGPRRPCSRSTRRSWCKPVWQFGDRLRHCPRKPLESSRHGEVEAKIIREHCAAVGLPKPRRVCSTNRWALRPLQRLWESVPGRWPHPSKGRVAICWWPLSFARCGTWRAGGTGAPQVPPGDGTY